MHSAKTSGNTLSLTVWCAAKHPHIRTILNLQCDLMCKSYLSWWRVRNTTETDGAGLSSFSVLSVGLSEIPPHKSCAVINWLSALARSSRCFWTTFVRFWDIHYVDYCLCSDTPVFYGETTLSDQAKLLSQWNVIKQNIKTLPEVLRWICPCGKQCARKDFGACFLSSSSIIMIPEHTAWSWRHCI